MADSRSDIPSPESAPDDEPDHSDIVAGVDERPQRRREWAGGLRSVVLPLLAVVAIVGAVWYVQQRGDGSGDHEQGTGIVPLPTDKNPTGKQPSVDEGQVAPDFVLRTVDGRALRLSDLRGKVVLINFWATWCGPCRQEVPELVRAYAEQADRGLEIVGVDLQEPEGSVRDFMDEFGMRFPVVIDHQGDVATAYHARTTGLPTTVFVDRQGIVRVIKFGAMTGDFLRRQLAALL